MAYSSWITTRGHMQLPATACLPSPTSLALEYVGQKPITRLLWFSLLDSIAVAGTRVTAAINWGFLFRLLSISVLYWALLLWFPLCRNIKPWQRGGEEKTERFCAQQCKQPLIKKGWHLEGNWNQNFDAKGAFTNVKVKHIMHTNKRIKP